MRLPSFFFPVLSVILSLVVIVGCWAVVTSHDLLRKEMEQMRGTLREVRESLALMPRVGAVVSSAEPGQAGADLGCGPYQFVRWENGRRGKIFWPSAGDTATGESFPTA